MQSFYRRILNCADPTALRHYVIITIIITIIAPSFITDITFIIAFVLRYHYTFRHIPFCPRFCH
jgi:hypothetical protein